MPAITEPKLISGNANLPLAKSIARRMSMHRGMTVNLVDARVERFNDQEIFVEVFENVRGEDMFIIQPTSNPANDNLMELLIITDALRRSSAARITAVIPYFGYARQDRRAKARTPISAKLVANLIDRGRGGPGADAGPARGADPGLLRHSGGQPLCRPGLCAGHRAPLQGPDGRADGRLARCRRRGAARANWPRGSTPPSPSSTSGAKRRARWPR